GTLAHGLDFDDTHAASITHASAVILPTVLALAEARDLDGRSAITAAVAGYEAITRLGMAASGAFHARGWHATSVCGAFGAALAAGVCERLDGRRLTAALGLAGSFASGVMEHLEDGSWVKRLHPGWAGHGGALAAALARGGVPGKGRSSAGRQRPSGGRGRRMTPSSACRSPSPLRLSTARWASIRTRRRGSTILASCRWPLA